VTLLQLAAYRGNEDLIKYLLERGVKDKEGKRRCYFVSLLFRPIENQELHSTPLLGTPELGVPGC
jgi:hypothetical protein